MNSSGLMCAKCSSIQRSSDAPWSEHRLDNGFRRRLQARRENLRKASVSLTHQVERLTEAYLAGILPREEYKRRRQELELKQAALANQMRQIEASATKQIELAGVVKSMEEFCQRVRQGLEQASFEQ